MEPLNELCMATARQPPERGMRAAVTIAQQSLRMAAAHGCCGHAPPRQARQCGGQPARQATSLPLASCHAAAHTGLVHCTPGLQAAPPGPVPALMALQLAALNKSRAAAQRGEGQPVLSSS